MKFYDLFQYNNPFYSYCRYLKNNLLEPSWETPKDVGIMSTTRQRCRGSCCRNARADGGISRKEYLSWLNALDELSDLGYNKGVIKKLSTVYVNKWYYT